MLSIADASFLTVLFFSRRFIRSFHSTSRALSTLPRILVIAMEARRESPPRSKKLSVTPGISSSSRTSFQTAAISSSSFVAGISFEPDPFLFLPSCVLLSSAFLSILPSRFKGSSEDTVSLPSFSSDGSSSRSRSHTLSVPTSLYPFRLCTA